MRSTSSNIIIVGKKDNASSCESPVSEDVLKHDQDTDQKLNKEQRIEYKDPVIRNQEEEEQLYQKGFKNTFMGSMMILYMAVISVFWIILLLVLCLDYYGYVVII